MSLEIMKKICLEKICHNLLVINTFISLIIMNSKINFFDLTELFKSVHPTSHMSALAAYIYNRALVAHQDYNVEKQSAQKCVCYKLQLD